ncbi:hypothetical protein I7I48_10205 [Histoplasma ohiense]|nr:hypothetical protein I7I48_10205 [Histoplasma ohiense (nom. inval.)]
MRSRTSAPFFQRRFTPSLPSVGVQRASGKRVPCLRTAAGMYSFLTKAGDNGAEVFDDVEHASTSGASAEPNVWKERGNKIHKAALCPWNPAPNVWTARSEYRQIFLVGE